MEELIQPHESDWFGAYIIILDALWLSGGSQTAREIIPGPSDRGVRLSEPRAFLSDLALRLATPSFHVTVWP